MTHKFKKFNAALLGLTTAVSLSACATGGANTVPIIDAQHNPQFNTDLAQCQALAAQVPTLSDEALVAALAGAGFGALAGSSFGGRPFSNRGRGENALAGALAGGAAGTAFGAFQGREAQADIVYRCMAGRGYRILG